MTSRKRIISITLPITLVLAACGESSDLAAYREGRSAGLALRAEPGHSTQTIGAACAAKQAGQSFSDSQRQAHVFGCTTTASGAPDLSSLFSPNASEREIRDQAQDLKKVLGERDAPNVSSQCLALAYLSLDVTNESSLGNTSWDSDHGGRQHRIFADECLS
jgi:hypothetical protein